jgi:hypothetical protein
VSIRTRADRRSSDNTPETEEQTMRYLLMIAGDENAIVTAPAQVQTEITDAYGEWAKVMAEKGALQGG